MPGQASILKIAASTNFATRAFLISRKQDTAVNPKHSNQWIVVKVNQARSLSGGQKNPARFEGGEINTMADANEKPQIDRFKEAARQLDCDDDKQRFETKLGKIAGTKPTKDETPKK